MAGLSDFGDWLSRNVDPRQIVSGAQKVGNFLDPARPFNEEAAGLDKGAADAKALSELEWQRQMQGLNQALGYLRHSQKAVANTYSHQTGNALPVGLAAAVPGGVPTGPAQPPGPPRAGPMAQGYETGGLGAYIQGRR